MNCRRQDLDGDLATERLVVGAIDLAHAADAEQGSDGVDAESLADALRPSGDRRRRKRANATAGTLMNPSAIASCRDQRFDFALQRVVAAARLGQKGRAIVGPQRQRRMAEILDLAPAFRRHDRSVPLSSRSSHSFAIFQSRLTVSRETCSASAVSSMLEPAEESHLDDLALALIDCGQRRQRVVERDEIVGRLGRHDERFVERQQRRAAATLLIAARRARSRRGSAASAAPTSRRNGRGSATGPAGLRSSRRYASLTSAVACSV